MAARRAFVANEEGERCPAVSVVFDGAFGHVVFRAPGATELDIERASAIAQALAFEMKKRGGPITGHVALNLGREGPIFRTVIDSVLQTTIDGERLGFSKHEGHG